MRKERFVCVEWDDASYNSGYFSRDNREQNEPLPCKTVGHLVKANRKVVVVATDRFGDRDDDLRHTSTIPRKMVTKIRHLGDK